MRHAACNKQRGLQGGSQQFATSWQHLALARRDLLAAQLKTRSLKATWMCDCMTEKVATAVKLQHTEQKKKRNSCKQCKYKYEMQMQVQMEMKIIFHAQLKIVNKFHRRKTAAYQGDLIMHNIYLLHFWHEYEILNDKSHLFKSYDYAWVLYNHVPWLVRAGGRLFDWHASPNCIDCMRLNNVNVLIEGAWGIQTTGSHGVCVIWLPNVAVTHACVLRTIDKTHASPHHNNPLNKHKSATTTVVTTFACPFPVDINFYQPLVEIFETIRLQMIRTWCEHFHWHGHNHNT